MSGLKETFTKRYIVGKGPVRQKYRTRRTKLESGKLLGEFMESNTVERAIKPKKKTHEQNKNEWTSSVGLCQNH